MTEWIWDVDKQNKKPKDWLNLVISWYLMTADNGQTQTVAQDENGHEMVLFRGTQQECREYIDEHTK